MSDIIKKKATSFLDILKEALKNSNFTNHIGAVPIFCKDGKSELYVMVTDDLKQHLDFIHGGVLGFVADSACSWAAASLLGNVVTAEYKINFIRPAVGEKIIGIGEVIDTSSSKKNAITKADVFTQSGKKQTLVATAIATISAIGVD